MLHRLDAIRHDAHRTPRKERHIEPRSVGFLLQPNHIRHRQLWPFVLHEPLAVLLLVTERTQQNHHPPILASRLVDYMRPLNQPRTIPPQRTIALPPTACPTKRLADVGQLGEVFDE
jgi:hypothetical protein